MPLKVWSDHHSTLSLPKIVKLLLAISKVVSLGKWSKALLLSERNLVPYKTAKLKMIIATKHYLNAQQFEILQATERNRVDRCNRIAIQGQLKQIGQRVERKRRNLK